jgi:hypothetical protein
LTKENQQQLLLVWCRVQCWAASTDCTGSAHDSRYFNLHKLAYVQGGMLTPLPLVLPLQAYL